jgi:hypothetical protein
MYNQFSESNMGLSIIPTNIGGVSLNGILGPLSSLFRPTSVQNLVYPSDLASNPAMGHAVQFSIYEYTTGFADNAITGAVVNLGIGAINTGLTTVSTVLGAAKGGTLGNLVTQTGAAAKETFNSLAENASKLTLSEVGAQVGAAAGTLVPAGAQLFQAKSYLPVKKGTSLANISLFMPETLNVQYSSDYAEVSMGDTMGIRGRIGNAYGDLIGQNPQNANSIAANPMANIYGKALAGELLGYITGARGFAQQAVGIVTNPQMQLLYKSVALRTFTLEFIMTPKDSAEAKTVKDICDTFTYFSLPGIAGAQYGKSGQYLTPPQIFSIKFKFLGQKGVLGTLSNIFNSAMSNIGLGFLTNTDPTGTITSGAEAKIMSINDCVLQDVNIDYAPNGWAAYNDGYPIQTRLNLTFKETEMITKQQFKGSAIEANYNRPDAGGTEFVPLPGLNMDLNSEAMGENGG